MKTHTLLSFGLGTLLMLGITGCKDPQPRVTHFDGPAVTGHDDPEKGARISGSGSPSELPNEDKLRGRDLDRSAFGNQTVYFEYDHANVKADEASKIDQVIAQFKTKGPDFDLLVEGHCDERGTEEYNRSLGERRALALRELLMKSGVNSDRVFTRSFGKDQPARAGHDESAWSRNRRGEFVLVLPKKFTTTQNTQ